MWEGIKCEICVIMSRESGYCGDLEKAGIKAEIGRRLTDMETRN